MTLLTRLGLGERLGALSVLLLLLAVLTGVSLTQAGLLDQNADELEALSLPALRQVNDVRRLIDDTRGLEALQLLTDDLGERDRLAQQLVAQRHQVNAVLARHFRPGATAAALDHDEGLRLQGAVRERLQALWAAQDKVLAALRPAPLLPALAPAGRPESAGSVGSAGPAEADGTAPDALRTPSGAAAAEESTGMAAARRLLAAESQLAWRALDHALQQWYLHQESRAAALARASRSQAEWLRLGVGGLLAMVLLACLAMLLWRWRRPARQGVAASGVPALGAELDEIVMQSRLVALNAAVQAARRGAPSPSEAAERAHLARVADALARRCDDARRQVRLARPPVRSSALGAEAGSAVALAAERQARPADNPASEHSDAASR